MRDKILQLISSLEFDLENVGPQAYSNPTEFDEGKCEGRRYLLEDMIRGLKEIVNAN
jgi:hypothetical protein